MRKLSVSLIAATAALLATGSASAAADRHHEMNVELPDGSVARITYVGNTAPQVIVNPVDLPAPIAWARFDSVFAELDRISALMDMQAQAMWQRAAEMQQQAASGAGPTIMTFGNFPAGTVQYSFVSTTTSNGTCTRSVEWHSDGSGAEPRMIRTSSGSCGSDQTPATDHLITASTSPAPQEPATGNRI